MALSSSCVSLCERKEWCAADVLVDSLVIV